MIFIKKWYQSPYDKVQFKLQENGHHSFYPILDEKQWHEVSSPKKTTRSMSKKPKTEYPRQYENPYASLMKNSKVLVSESSSGSEEKPLLKVKKSEENASSNSSSSQDPIEKMSRTSPENLTQQGCCQKIKEWIVKAKNLFRPNPQASKKES